MNDDQLLRYSRHILLNDIGIEGQQQWLAAHAVVIGAGGLGSPAALYLASAGIGAITLVDHDRVELTNLQRQILHTTERVGQLKAESGKYALGQINPDVKVTALATRLDGEHASELVRHADVVLDCTDNFETRHTINQACVQHGIPLVSGAAIGFAGQISVFDTRDAASPCYACLFPPDRQSEETHCSTMGVFAPLTGVIGAMQAAEALKLLASIGSSLAGRLLMLEARAMEWTEIRVPRDAACTICGHR